MYTDKTNAIECPPGRMRSRKAGFSLVEVTMALGLMSFCLVAMLGLLPVGLKQARLSTDQVAAMQVLAAVRSDFQYMTNGMTQEYKIEPGAAEKRFFVDSSLKYTDRQSDALYRVDYAVASPAGSQAPLMHLFISRVSSGPLAQANVLAEGIAQQRVN